MGHYDGKTGDTGTMTVRSGWGGKRPGTGGARRGAGRTPLAPGVRKVRRSVSLEERHWRWLDGTGNASAALRELVRAALAPESSDCPSER
jgi:hypothetical protein